LRKPNINYYLGNTNLLISIVFNVSLCCNVTNFFLLQSKVLFNFYVGDL